MNHQVLHSKLTIPRLASAINRELISEIHRDTLNKKLTLIIAGAGFGKTTLASQLVKKSKQKTLWYSIDKSDQDFVVFMTYLISGIQKYFPEKMKDCKESLIKCLPSKIHRETFLLGFLVELEKTVCEEFYIVLDDFYLLENNPEIGESIEFLLQHLPSNIHIIIISRCEPALKISRLRTMQQVNEIGEELLSFNSSEISALFNELFKLQIEKNDIETLFKKSKGWIAALILFYNGIKKTGPEKKVQLPENIQGSHKFIYQYFDENIYESQSDSVKEFLLKTSLTERIEPDISNQLLNIENAKEILLYLEENHLFTTPIEENRNSYSYHHLLRDYLREKLTRKYSRNDINQLHQKIADIYHKKGRGFEAINHHIKGESFDRSCKLLSNIGFKQLITGNISIIRDSLNKTPKEFIESNPDLLYLKGKIISISGDPYGAISLFKKSLSLYKNQNTLSGVTNCLKDLGVHYYLTGDIEKAESRIKKLYGKKVPENTFFPVEILVYLILLSSLLGNIDEADSYYQTLPDLESGFGTKDSKTVRACVNLSHSFRFCITGDFKRSHLMNIEALNIFLKNNISVVLPMTYFQIAYNCYFMGLFQEGYDYAKKGIEAAKKEMVFDHQYAWLLWSYSINSLMLNKKEKAFKYAKESLWIFESHNHLWGQAYVYDLLHLISKKSGDLNGAEVNIKTGIKLIEDLKINSTQGILLRINYAALLITRGELGKVELILNSVEGVVKKFNFYNFLMLLIHSRYFHEKGMEEEAITKLESALTISEEGFYDHYLINEEKWIVQPLIRLYFKGVFKSYIKKIISNSGKGLLNRLIQLSEQGDKEALKLYNEIERRPKPLKIYLLGTFKVFSGDEQIPAESWKSTKATTLFKYLVLNRNRGYLSKDILIELLWPDGDIEKTGKRFNVALTFIRKILEPDLIRGMNSSYILKQKDAYKLDPGINHYIDCEDFTRKFGIAMDDTNSGIKKRLENFLAAEKVYKGSFLMEDIYENWCADERERLHGLYLDCLRSIIDIYGEEKNHLKTMEYLKIYLEYDNYSEKMYRHLMRLYSTLGDNPGVVKTFERCREKISELDCPLNKKTTDLFTQLIQK